MKRLAFACQKISHKHFHGIRSIKEFYMWFEEESDPVLGFDSLRWDV